MQTWKPINEFYAISDIGNVFRYKGTKGSTKPRQLKPFKNYQGYYRIALRIDYKEKRMLVHRLVWEAFNGKIPKGMVINHLDGNKSNNQLSNLEMCTYSENTKHSIEVLGNIRKGISKPSLRKLSDTQVEEIKELIANGLSLRQTAKRYGVAQSTISRIKLKQTCY